MINFNDRYIVLAILLPGIFLLGNLHWTFVLYPDLLPPPFLYKSNASLLLYNLVISLILGGLCWYIHHKKWLVDAFDTTKLLKKLKNREIANFEVVTERYQTDFGIPLLPDSEDIAVQKKYLKGSVDNIFFTMDRAFGMEKPSVYRTLLDVFAGLVIATALSIFFMGIITLTFIVRHFSEPLEFNLSAMLFTGVLLLLYFLIKQAIMPELRAYYHYGVFAVYADNQYRNKMNEFIRGNAPEKHTPATKTPKTTTNDEEEHSLR